MIPFVDKYLNETAMYRVLVHTLGGLSLVAIALSGSGQLPASPLWMAASLLTLVVVCRVSNNLFARLVGAAENHESWLVTALILFLILFPATDAAGIAFLTFASVAAMGSKYLITRHNRHFLNPAAVGAVAVGLIGYGAAWWVATAPMLPFVAIAAYLVVKKVRRGELFLIYVATVVLARIIFWLSLGAWPFAVPVMLWETLSSWPVLFFAAFMLTEPLTLPADRGWQRIEAFAVGVFSVIPFHIGPLASTPELALLMGNVLSACVMPKRLLRLTLAEKTEVAPGLWDFAFTPDVPARFEPGQYFEWTLPHANPDSRGNRRTFTVASSPAEPHVHLGVRIPAQKASSFKTALGGLSVGDHLAGSNVLGDFILPKDTDVPLAWIAGGIGVTPFRSMAQDMVDTRTTRNVVMFYACKTDADFAYRDVFTRAEPHGLRPIYLTDLLSADRITSDVPDFASRLWYLSGPPVMVDAYKKLLRSMGVQKKNIRTDYFPGY